MELAAVLPDLVEQHGLELELVCGEAHRRLVDEMGGAAGRLRW